jgi:hypothetical protein
MLKFRSILFTIMRLKSIKLKVQFQGISSIKKNNIKVVRVETMSLRIVQNQEWDF